jgi:predicted DCC family thiol-disulfide oxidoreductase YuxK
MDVPAAIPQPVVLYDGTCGLCHRSVRWLMKRDRRRLWYAPLQGETAAALRATYPIPATLDRWC